MGSKGERERKKKFFLHFLGTKARRCLKYFLLPNDHDHWPLNSAPLPSGPYPLQLGLVGFGGLKRRRRIFPCERSGNRKKAPKKGVGKAARFG